jgi:glucokinase
MSDFIIGVNIEDHHISAGLVNMETRKVVPGSTKRTKVDSMGTEEQIVTTWSNVLKEVAGETKQIGVGLPGLCDYEAGVYLHQDPKRYYSLYQKNLKDIFSQIIGATPGDVKLLNDAACFLQGEVFAGSGRGFKSSLGVTLGLGLGSAIYSNGVVTDANLHAMPFYDATAEDYISIRGLLGGFKKLTGIELKDIAEMKQYADSDPRFKEAFDQFATSLADFLEIFIRKHSPEVVVIGGFMELYNRFFFDNLCDKMKAKGFKLPVLRAMLGEQASIIGAASAWYSTSQIHVR